MSGQENDNKNKPFTSSEEMRTMIMLITKAIYINILQKKMKKMFMAPNKKKICIAIYWLTDRNRNESREKEKKKNKL